LVSINVIFGLLIIQLTSRLAAVTGSLMANH
jgi:hypothetical protein